MIQTFKAYQYKLQNLSATQSHRLNSWIGACRFVYNLVLETKQHACQAYGVNLSRFDLDKQLVAFKEVDWIKDIPIEELIDYYINVYFGLISIHELPHI